MKSGPDLLGPGPNARPRHGAALNSGVITSPFSVNRDMTFLWRYFNRTTIWISKRRQIVGVDLHRLHDNTI